MRKLWLKLMQLVVIQLGTNTKVSLEVGCVYYAIITRTNVCTCIEFIRRDKGSKPLEYYANSFPRSICVFMQNIQNKSIKQGCVEGKASSASSY